MTADEKAMLRKALLRACERAAPASLPLPTLKDVAEAAGFDALADADVKRELHWLVSDGLLATKENAFAAGVTRWEITSKGMDALARY